MTNEDSVAWDDQGGGTSGALAQRWQQVACNPLAETAAFGAITAPAPLLPFSHR